MVDMENGQRHFELFPVERSDPTVSGFRVKFQPGRAIVIPDLAYIVFDSLRGSTCDLTFYQMIKGEVIPQGENLRVVIDQSYEIIGHDSQILIQSSLRHTRNHGWNKQLKVLLYVPVSYPILTEDRWKEREFSV